MVLNTSSKLHIVIAAGVYPPDVGGPATYAAMVADGLPEYGYDVSVLPFHTVRQLPTGVRHVLYAWRLWRATKRGSTVMALDAVSVGLPALLVSRLRRAQLIVRLGGDFAWEQGRQRYGVTATLDQFTATPLSTQPWPVRVLAAAQRFVAKRAVVVVVPSNYLAGIVRQWSGVRAEQLVIVPSVVSPLPAPQPQVTPATKYAILTAGRLVPWKGVDGVIAVLPSLPDTTLLVAGDGPMREQLKVQAHKSGVSDRVQFLGALTKQELANYLAVSDVFVLNTAYEGLSHMLLEVMAAGLPVVTTDVGGNPELITHNETGLLVPPDDQATLQEAVVRLLAESQLRIKLQAAAVEKASYYTKSQSLAQLDALLKKL